MSSEARSPHQVWARVVWAAANMGLEAGMSQDGLFAGLPFDPETLRRRKRVGWDDYCMIVERIAEFVGGPRELEDLVESTYHLMFPEFRRLAGLMLGPKALFRFIVDTVDPLLFPPVDARWEDLDRDVIRVTMRLMPGARPCEAWFRGTVGSARGLTRHLDLEPAEVLAVDVGAEHMLLDLRLPPSKTIAARGRRATERALQWLHVKFVIGAELDGSEVSMLVGEPAPNPIELRVSQATIAWKLSPRQADVLPLLVLGAANKEIAQRLGTAENTVEFHVTALLRKAKVPSRAQLAARFWALGD